MGYTINTTAFAGSFPVPHAVAEKLKLSNEKQLKVIIYVLANLSEEISAPKISEKLSIPQREVEDALDYWTQIGILKGEKEVKAAEEPTKRVATNSARPSRGDVARRGLEDKNLHMLLSEAQLKFGRNLKTNESAGLVWIYDDLGLDISVILLLLQYALSEERLNITFLEKTAAKWSEQGIDTVLKAEKFISDEANKKLSWRRVEKAFGIEHRRPSEKEAELAELWICRWGLGEEILIAAYDECVNQKSKFNISYTAKILENWHKDGVKTAADIKKKEKTPAKSKTRSFAAYDIELYKQKLKSDD